MSNHTPGPWHITECHRDMEPRINASTAYGEIAVAKVCLFGTPATAANARLIRAAPELLEALRKIAFEPFGNPEASDRHILDAITEFARGAIAKAESSPVARGAA